MTRPDGTMTARPTVYRGIPMRSRLEARYAAFLDRKDATWEYEPRAYAGQRGQYLPDFVVHTETIGDVFVEVKPTVAMALAALGRMEVIWESDPDASLLLVVLGAGAYRLLPGDSCWRWFSDAKETA